jgi:branched-subunit amino acid ABC-type transport system permease component
LPVEIYLNVAASGLLTGLVYGLMALGLSVIFGVVRVVNFAHGEMMTLAMYLTLLADSSRSGRSSGRSFVWQDRERCPHRSTLTLPSAAC